jgi:hypothetical protein
MPNLQNDIIDGALTQYQSQQDASLAASVEREAAPVRQQLANFQLPDLGSLLQGLNPGGSQTGQQQSTSGPVSGQFQATYGSPTGQFPATYGSPTGQFPATYGSPAGQSSYNDPTTTGTLSSPLPPQRQQGYGFELPKLEDLLGDLLPKPQRPQAQASAVPGIPTGIPGPDQSPNGTPISAPGFSIAGGKSPEGQQAVYRAARAAGRSDEDARILAAVTETEGGWGGAVGDQGQAHGIYQFHARGEMPAFKAWLQQQGIQGDPYQLAYDPDIATRYAATTYLGRALDEGRARGLSGAQLATYVQANGQRSVSPEKTGQNYERLFGAGTQTASIPGPEQSPNGTPISVPQGAPRPLQGITPEQYGLGDADADSICGPVLAMAFARSNGRNPTIAEAKQLAAANGGWNSAQGMGGPYKMAETLRAMGVPATYQPGALDIAQIRRETQNGNPVGINTSDHYFVVEGVDEQGRLDLGNSAKALRASGGRQWFRPEEIADLGMGAPTGAIYKDAPSSPTPSVAVKQTGLPPVNPQPAQQAPVAPPQPSAADRNPDDRVEVIGPDGGKMTVPRFMFGEGPGKYAPSKGWRLADELRQSLNTGAAADGTPPSPAPAVASAPPARV